MNKRIGFGISIMAVVLLAGCASTNSNMQSKLDAMEAKSQAQEKQIADLKKQEVTPMQDKVVDGAKTAWTWTSNEAQAAWNSDTAVDARARLEHCYEDLKKSGDNK